MINKNISRMTNTGKIAKLRRVDVSAAIDFWKEVCAETRRHLSTYDVLKLLLAQEEHASSITAQKLAITSLSRTQREEQATSTASPPHDRHPLRLPEVSYVVAVPAVTTVSHSNCHESCAKSKAVLVAKYNLDGIEAAEISSLLDDMLPLRFTHSGQLSKYIASQNLGYKYPNISGVVRMKEEGTEWDFNGGFPPRIYRIICTELGLNNQGTNAQAVGFRPYKEINSRNR